SCELRASDPLRTRSVLCLDQSESNLFADIGNGLRDRTTQEQHVLFSFFGRNESTLAFRVNVRDLTAHQCSLRHLSPPPSRSTVFTPISLSVARISSSQTTRYQGKESQEYTATASHGSRVSAVPIL